MLDYMIKILEDILKVVNFNVDSSKNEIKFIEIMIIWRVICKFINV